MSASAFARSLTLALCLTCLATTGCHVFARKKRQQANPAILYQTAHRELLNYNYKAAIKVYENLTARFPFTDEARQARIDLIYAYYRDDEADAATDAADEFIRENPTHPRVDYAWYVKGLVYFSRSPNLVERVFRADLTKRPPDNELKAFDAFKTVVEQFPKSAYAYDAHQRMIFLRNRLADYDVHVADYYMRRGAYVGAARRANGVIEDYDGAPAVREALQIMIVAYDKLGLKEREAQVREVYQTNFPNSKQQYVAQYHHWWKFW